MLKGYLLSAFILFYLFTNAANYYVDAVNGSNANSGLTPPTAFLTVQTAANLTNPGDTVFIMNGTYTASGTILNISRSGADGAPIVYTAYPGHSPKLSASVTTFNIIQLSPGVSYITINGLEIEGYGVNMSLAADTAAAQAQVTCPTPGSAATSETIITRYNGNGIISDSRSISGGSHHLIITNNKVHDCGGGGIGILKADYVTVSGNTVYNCSWYSIFGNSGISFNQFYNFDNNTATYRNSVSNNVCYNNRMYVLWRAVCRITDGNGIIMDVAEAAYSGKTLLANNIVYNNGGSGIHSLQMKNLDIFHNVAYLNSQSPAISNGEIYANSSDNVRIINNILVAGPAEKVNGIYNTTNLVYDYNIYAGGSSVDVVGTHSLIRDPQLLNLTTDPATANFRPKMGSVAIDNGDNSRSTPLDKDGSTRPINTTVEIGGYESSSAGPFGARGAPTVKTLGNGNGTGEGSAGYFYGPYESRPNSANRKSRRAIIYPQTLLSANGVPSNVILDALQFRRAVQNSTTDVTPSTSFVPDNSIVRIYLRNEAADNFGSATFDWTSILPGSANPAVLVYGGEASVLIGAAGGWKSVPFQVPFNYTGGNLGVFIEYLQKGSNSNTDIGWIYDNGGSQPLYNTGTNPNQLYASKYTSTTGIISDALATNNERRPVMRVSYISPVTAPVRLQQFTAAKRGNDVLVNWITATETDNAGFDVQRSADGINFSPVGFVASKATGGNSSSPIAYAFTDAAPLKGIGYYRLLQKDKSGRTEYSPIVSVLNKGGDWQLLNLYPNPVTDNLNVRVKELPQSSRVIIRLHDASGRVVHQAAKHLAAGDTNFKIDISRQPASVYLLVVELASGAKKMQRFSKL